MNHMFVLFVNDNGFIDVNNQFVNNVTKAQIFNSHEMAEKHRAMIYNKNHEFQNTISILEWL